MKLTRREFILTSSGILLASKSSIFAQKKKQHVIIAGAGLAGLSAAYELVKKGFDVTIIEGRNRVGGRVFTLRKPFSEDLQVESGGELLGDGYERMLGYAERFGIQYEEQESEFETGGSVAGIQYGIGRTAYMKGKLYRKGTVFKKHPYKLKGDESIFLPQTVLGRNTRLIYNAYRENKITLEDLDKLSLAKTLKQNGVSKKAIDLIDISLNYNSIKTVSTAGFIYDTLKRRNAGTVSVKIVGGNDLIPNAIAKEAQKLGVNILLSSRIKKISQNKNGVKVEFHRENRKTQTISGDKLVCTIPFSVLREIEFSPKLPSEKVKAINELEYTKNTKVHIQSKYIEWDRRSLGSSVWTDTPIERIFASTGRIGDERAIFTIWTEGNGSKFLEQMPQQKRLRYGKTMFEKVLPFMKGGFEKSHTYSWSQDEFIRGAYSHLKVGQYTSIHPHIKTNVGNIHFAGEHTADEFPGMEGALESAERVVEEVS